MSENLPKNNNANNNGWDELQRQALAKAAAAYNEAHADEAHEEWREAQGLNDEEFIKNQAANETEERWRAFYRNRGEEFDGGEPTPDQEPANETEERWRAFYKNLGEDFDGEDSGAGDPNGKKDPLNILQVVGGNNQPSPNPNGEQPKTKEELEKEREENEKRKAEIEAELIELNASGLIAVNANVEEDRDALATLEAENAFNTDKGKAKFFKRIWMNYFERYYKTKYKREILSGDRTIEIDGKQVDLDTVIHDRSRSGIGRVVKSVAEKEMDYIHQKFNEKQGEVDEKTTEAVRKAIIEYANARGDNGDEKLFTAKLKEQIAKLKQEGNYEDPNYVNNYFEVAENAIKIKELLRGEVAMEKVLEKFAVYNNAVIHDAERTEVHRNTMDQLVRKWEKSGISRFISPETVAVATSVVSLFAKSGLSRAARLLIPVGGIAASGFLAGVRERYRVTNDRETMMRNRENGQDYVDNPENLKGVAKKRSKYEAKIAGTNYDIKPAKDLIADINKALESGDENKIMEAYTAARVRTDLSDSESKGLIAFSSAGKRGDERHAVDTAIIEAKRRINTPKNKAKLEEMAKTLTATIEQDIDEKDDKFKRVRAGQVAKQVTKTVAIGAATFIFSQEAMAALDENQVGILEKWGILKTKNQVDAKDTMLASLVKSDPNTVEVYTNDEAEISRYEQQGYKVTKLDDEVTSSRPTYTEGSPATSTEKASVYVREWANNGTEPYDGNELRAVMDEKYNLVTTMYGDSYAPISGRTLNFENLVQGEKLKGFITINGTRFEALGTKLSNGQVEFIHNGMVRTPGGALIQAIDKNTGGKLYEYFEIGGIYGKDPATGLTEFVPMATDVGVPEGTPFTGIFMEKANKITDILPAKYQLELPPAGVTYDGIIAPVSSARVGIGRGTPRQETSRGGTGQTPAPAPKPNPNGGGTGQNPAPKPNPDGGGTGQTPAPAPAPKQNPAPAPAPKQNPTPGNTAPDPNSQPGNANGGQPDEDQPNPEQAKRERDVYINQVNSMQKHNQFTDETAKILLEKPDDATRTDEEYKDFYNNLGYNEKQLVNILFSRYANFSPLVLEGRGFMEWMRRQNQ